jgi:hypothetical protein
MQSEMICGYLELCLEYYMLCCTFYALVCEAELVTVRQETALFSTIVSLAFCCHVLAFGSALRRGTT